MSASAPLPSAGPGSGTWAPPAVGSAAARRRPHRRGARPGCHGALVVRAPVRRPAAVLEPARRVGRAGRLPTLRFVDADDAPAAASTTTLLRDATSVIEVRCSTVRCGSPGAGGPGPHDDTGSRHGTRSATGCSPPSTSRGSCRGRTGRARPCPTRRHRWPSRSGCSAGRTRGATGSSTLCCTGSGLAPTSTGTRREATTASPGPRGRSYRPASSRSPP